MKYVVPLLAISALLAAASPNASADDWLAFRGTDHTCAGEATDLPAAFDENTNVAWRAELPGVGPSSPIVLGDLVVVTAATGVKQDRLHVLAFDKRTGECVWRRQFWATGHTMFHPFGGMAANTPVSDGRRIVAMYSSNDVACLDLAGNLLWYRGLAYDFPSVRNDTGMASSPVIVGDLAIVQCDNQGESFVAGLSLETGETVWSLDRPRDVVWSSPTVMRGATGDRPIVLLVGRDGLTGVDPTDGRKLFLYEADCNTMASATTMGRDIFLPANGIHHLQYDPATENVEIAWVEPNLRGIGSPSPALRGDRIYVLKRPGVLAAADIESGRKAWEVRVPGRQHWASPVLADGKAYVATHDGDVHVVALGDRGELLETNRIEEGVLATPAVDEDAIYFRTNAALWKVSK